MPERRLTRGQARVADLSRVLDEIGVEDGDGFTVYGGAEAVCLDCGKRLEPRTMWPEVRGFARPRSQRGQQSGSSLVFREPTGRGLCPKCALDRLHGRSGQAGLDL